MPNADKAARKLRLLWKPDGETPDLFNQAEIEQWMNQNGLSASPGAITALLNKPEFADVRKAAVKALKAQQSERQYEIRDIPTEEEADRIVSDFVSEGCRARKFRESDGDWTVVAYCPF